MHRPGDSVSPHNVCSTRAPPPPGNIVGTRIPGISEWIQPPSRDSNTHSASPNTPTTRSYYTHTQTGQSLMVYSASIETIGLRWAVCLSHFFAFRVAPE